MLDFLIASLPGALESVVKWALLGSAAVLVLVLLIRRFSTRKALLVRTFGNPAREFHIEGKEIADALRRRLMDIRQVHSGEGLKSAGESTKLGDPRRASENLSAKAISFVASKSTLGFLVGLSSKLWPTLELEGEVVVGEDESLICYSRLKRGGEYFHAWQLPAPERRAAVKECADELACRIVLDTARLGVLAQSEKKRLGSTGSGERPRSAGTRTWKAFRAMTEALRIWNSPDFEVTDDDQISRVDARLEEAIAHDDGYALAHYNRGTLHCLRFKNAATNAMARSHFERAYELTQEQATEASEGGRTVDYRIEGLAALGLARTYSQDRHRYGRLDEQTVAAARRWANEAIKAMGEVPPALLRPSLRVALHRDPGGHPEGEAAKPDHHRTAPREVRRRSQQSRIHTDGRGGAPSGRW